MDVDLHGLVTTIWNRKDYTNLKNVDSIGSIVLLSVRLFFLTIQNLSLVGER